MEAKIAMLILGVLMILLGIVVAIYGNTIDPNILAGAPLMIFAGIILAVFSQIPAEKS